MTSMPEMSDMPETPDDNSPFVVNDPVNDPFNDQAHFAPLLAAQMAIESPASLPQAQVHSQESDQNNEPEKPISEGSPVTPMSADSDAEADLPRAARAQQFRQSRRLQVSSAFPALAMIGIGSLLIANPVWLTSVMVMGLAIAAIGISFVARFWLNGRRERGLCFLGLSILLWEIFLTAVIARGLLLDHIWPILIMGLGLALLCTFLFERVHERNVILPGIALIIAGGIAMMFTWPLLPLDWLDNVKIMLTYWPILVIVLAVLLIPRAFRRVN